jgi:hypothetical protein
MNQMVRMPAIGARMGDWVWDGCNWVCDGNDGPPVCPPPVPSPPPFGPPVFSGPAGQPPWYPGANGGVSFGQSFPPNPVRGHFFFDGITLWLFDGATWCGVTMSNTGGGNGTPPAVTVPSGPNPPFAPTVGGLWFNGTTLFVWDGHQWVPATQTKTWMQALAPATPAPGDLWFDGAQLSIYSGTAWVIIGPQAGPAPGTGQTDIVFQMQQPNGLALTPATGWAVIPYSAPALEDTQGGWNSVTHRFTATVAGVYYVSLRINAGVGAAVAVVKDDTNDFSGVKASDIVPAFASIAAAGWVVANGMVDMNGSSDYIRPWTNHGGTLPNAGSNPVFIVTKMP